MIVIKKKINGFKKRIMISKIYHTEKDFREIIKLFKIPSIDNFNKIKLRDIRETKIHSRFINLDNLLNSIERTVNHVKKGEMIDKELYSDLEIDDRYLDDWISLKLYHAGLMKDKHEIIVYNITELILCIYKYRTVDSEMMRYYKRYNSVHFIELLNWTTAIKKILSNRI